MPQLKELSDIISLIKGKQLDDLNLACEMMLFSFGEYEIHAQGFARIVKDNDIITTTLDYQSWDGENDKNNDEWHFAAQYKDVIVGGAVVSVEVSPVNDVKILLDNGTAIELFIANGHNHYAEENEQWVLFKRNDSEFPFVTVKNKSVEGI